MKHSKILIPDKPRRTSPHLSNKQAGAALIVSILVLVMLTLLGVTGLRMGGLQEKMTGNQKLLAQAEFAAERGISQGISDLMSGVINDTGAGERVSLVWSETGTRSGSGYTTNYAVSHKLVEGGGAIALDSAGLPYYKIESTGKNIDASGADGKASLDLEVAVNLTYSSNFSTGLVGCKGVAFKSNTTTSSYSSSGAVAAGDRGDVGTTDAGSDIILRSNASILGDASAVGEIQLLGGEARVERDAYANGDIHIKDGGSSKAYIRQDAFSHGNIYYSENDSNASNGSTPNDGHGTDTPNTSTEPYTPPDCDPIGVVALLADEKSKPFDSYEAGWSSYVNGGNDYFNDSASHSIGVSGTSTRFYFNDFEFIEKTLTIFGDVTFYVDDDFKMDGSPKLQLVSGATLTIYVEDRFDLLSNTEANFGGIPGAFQIYSSATTSLSNFSYEDFDSSKVYIDSNAKFDGLIYAPFAHVIVKSNSITSGAIRGRWVDYDSDAEFRYDEDLENFGGGTADDYNLVYWTQQSFAE